MKKQSIKNVVVPLSFLILFQSCFSYRTVNYSEISNDKKQKIELEMLDRTKLSGQLVSIDDKSITLENNGIEQKVLKNDIYEIKIKKFSIFKSLKNIAKAGAWAAATAGILFIYALSKSDGIP
jgi:regulatory protein YycH of two-component signal transduction system YycFG